jgi:hypothetical protein
VVSFKEYGGTIVRQKDIPWEKRMQRYEEERVGEDNFVLCVLRKDF